MSTTKRTIILTSLRGVEGMATFTSVNGAVSFSVSVSAKSGYKVVVKCDKEYVYDVISTRATFLLPPFDISEVGVEVFADGKLFCRGGKDFSEEVKKGEECKDDAENESEESENKEDQKEERVTYTDDAVVSENYYPEDIKVMCVDGKSEAVMLSARINAFVENSCDGLFDCKIVKSKKDEKAEHNVKTEKRGRVTSFGLNSSAYDEVASTVVSVGAVDFSRKAYYFEEVKDRIDELFKMGTREKELEELMPDTRWVRVEHSYSAYYVVGLIGGKRDMPDYICYGVPSAFSALPPRSLGRDARWVPINVREPQGRGYWLLFQSAKSGETVKSE